MVEEVLLSQALEPLWQKIAKTTAIKAPFFDYRWHASWYKTVAKNKTPYVLLVNKNVIAAFERDGTHLVLAGGKEVADYNDIIGTEGNKKVAWKELVGYLKNQGITRIVLENVPQDSQTLSFFQKNGTSSSDTIIKAEDTTPKLALPDNWEVYLQSLSRKHRHELRRKLRKFQEDHPVAHYVRSEAPEKDCDALFALMREDERKRKFLDRKMEAFFRELIRVFHKEAVIDFICIDNNCAATILCFNYEGIVYLYNSGLDISHYPGAGFFLKAKSIKKAIADTMTAYNFLQGNERYKYELGGKDFFVHTIDTHLA